METDNCNTAPRPLSQGNQSLGKSKLCAAQRYRSRQNTATSENKLQLKYMLECTV